MPNNDPPTDNDGSGPEHIRIDLERLASSGTERITAAWCRVLAECASLCLNLNEHISDTLMAITGKVKTNCTICPIAIDDAVRATYNDPDFAAEHGAIAVAFELIRIFTPMVVIRRSKKRTGFDYWLGEKDDPLFQDRGRLEVSGLLKQNVQRFNERIKQKINQTKASDSTSLPACIVVVTFLYPKAHMYERKEIKNEPASQ